MRRVTRTEGEEGGGPREMRKEGQIVGGLGVKGREGKGVNEEGLERGRTRRRRVRWKKGREVVRARGGRKEGRLTRGKCQEILGAGKEWDARKEPADEEGGERAGREAGEAGERSGKGEGQEEGGPLRIRKEGQVVRGLGGRGRERMGGIQREGGWKGQKGGRVRL